MTENNEWRFEELEEDLVASTIYPIMRKKILENLGTRKIDDNELNELTCYWASSIVSHYAIRERISKSNFFQLSAVQMVDLLVEKTDEWGRGIELYNAIAGESLTEIIEAKVKEKKVKILDIGCGDAYCWRQLQTKYPEITCVGIANKIQNRINGIQEVNAIAEVLPTQFSNQFDLITCFNASMYFYDHSRAFNEALRVLNPNGILFYGDGCLKSLGNKNLMERMLGVENFKYTITNGNRHGEEYDGIFAKWLTKVMPFQEYRKRIDQNPDRLFSEHCKKFRLEERCTKSSWDGGILKITGLGEISN